MRKPNQERTQRKPSEDNAIANHHARTVDVMPVEKSLKFTGTGENAASSSIPVPDNDDYGE
jgi:hypothetical protein